MRIAALMITSVLLNAISVLSGGCSLRLYGQRPAKLGASPTVGQIPPTASDFLVLPSGTDLRRVKVRGQPLGLVTGTGAPFTAADQRAYEELRDSTTSQSPIQWIMTELGSGRVVARSPSPGRRFYGASVTKLYVAQAYLHQRGGTFGRQALQQLADLIVVSDNVSWRALERALGEGQRSRGQRYLLELGRKFGYVCSTTFAGWLGKIHGNVLCVQDIAKFMFDTFHRRYDGADLIWRLMFTSRTGAQRLKHFIPQSIPVGGKTGTYYSKRVDPKNPGRPIVVRVVHHAIVFPWRNKYFSLTVFTDLGRNRPLALIAGGLIREHLGVKDPRAPHDTSAAAARTSQQGEL